MDETAVCLDGILTWTHSVAVCAMKATVRDRGDTYTQTLFVNLSIRLCMHDLFDEFNINAINLSVSFGCRSDAVNKLKLSVSNWSK